MPAITMKKNILEKGELLMPTLNLVFDWINEHAGALTIFLMLPIIYYQYLRKKS